MLIKDKIEFKSKKQYSFKCYANSMCRIKSFLISEFLTIWEEFKSIQRKQND